MNKDIVAALKKVRMLGMGVALLCAFTASMKAAGIFALGTFPWWSEAAISVLSGLYGLRLTFKIRHFQSRADMEDTSPQIKALD